MGYRKTPRSVRADLTAFSDPQFMIGASRDLDDWEAVTRLPLAASVDEEELRTGNIIQFVPETGRFGRWNVHGHIIKRRDLPKIEKTYAWESRNFGRSDTSTRFTSRMVYRSELLHGRQMSLSVQATPRDADGYVVYVRCRRSRTSPTATRST